MFHTMPVARSMPTSSSGDWMARDAASRALPRPTATPWPIRLVPAPDMMVRTSAKSTLTRPGTWARGGEIGFDAMLNGVREEAGGRGRALGCARGG
jgi:hypothetical protein